MRTSPVKKKFNNNERVVGAEDPLLYCDALTILYIKLNLTFINNIYHYEANVKQGT